MPNSLTCLRKRFGIVNPSALLSLMQIKRKLRPYNIRIRPSEIIKNKERCTSMLEEVERRCPEALFIECLQIVGAIGNLDSTFDLDYGDPTENAISTYFFRRLHQHNPIIQDALEMIHSNKGNASI